jgi:hypothetical protein
MTRFSLIRYLLPLAFLLSTNLHAATTVIKAGHLLDVQSGNGRKTS